MSELSTEDSMDLFQSLQVIAEAHPHAPAIVDGGSVISFEALVARSELLARSLASAGLVAGDRIALILSNSAWFAVSAFAVWKLGGILVPFHARLLEAELLKYITDGGIKAILATERMSSTVELIQSGANDVEHAWLWSTDGIHARDLGRRARSAGSSEIVIPGATGERSAVSLHSTGSTGRPKRITRSHRQLLGEVKSVSRLMRLSVDDRILGAIPFFHTYGLINGFLCGVLSGCRVYAVNDFFPKDIAKLIERERITGFPGVPFMYELLADVAGVTDFASLRYAMSAGAPLSRTTAEKFRAKHGIHIRQHYGTTETGFVSIEPDGGTSRSVGTPIPGVSVQILDDAQRAVAIGEQGNVAIESCFAAQRYDNFDESTESSFKGRLFFPGDLGHIAEDGSLILSGRKRRFINVAGNKVDPTEVETVLKELPAVSEAIVIGVPDGDAGEKIKAVIVIASPCTGSEIYAYCSQKLADFKRPRSIVFRKELLKSPSGKVIRNYLMYEDNVERQEYLFDPRFGFKRTNTRSSDEAASDFGDLSPFLRVILTTDGTVTKGLEAFFWEPIDVDLLLHVETESDQEYPELAIRTKDPLVRRRVVLRGRFTNQAYAFAETLIVSDAFAPPFRRMLVEGRKGIGELLREWRLETYRELVAVERTRAGQWAGYLALDRTAKVSVRRYNVYLKGRAAIQITEVFAEDRF